MQVDALSAVLRPRRSWEAIDLGFSMVQRWFGPVYRIWFILLLPLFIVLNLVCWQQPWLAALILWWLKPLLDRIPLYVLSHALFGNVPGLRETLRALPRLLWRGVIPALSWRRFDPARSFHLPLLQLENLSGRALRTRRQLLDQDSQGSRWLTIVCLHLDFALQFALLGLFAMLFPELLNRDFLLWMEHFSWFEQIGLNLIALLALSIIEPFYVAAGFALYLNRRTILEAWDLEIGFRRLAERLAKLPARSGTVATTLILALMLALPPPLPAQEQDPAADPAVSVSEACEALFARQDKLRRADSDRQQTLAKVFEEPEFGHCRKTTSWRFGPDDWRQDSANRRAGADSWLPGLADVIELLLWTGLAVFVVLLSLWLYRQRGQWRPARRPTVDIVAPPLHGQSATVPQFADDAADQAWQLWQSGQQRRALSLLYRASLARLTLCYRIELAPGATEDECLRQAHARLDQPELLDFLQRLTRLWQGVAYAGRAADSCEVQQLCRQWAGFFVATAVQDT